MTAEAALLAGAGTLAGASVQSATGFGFALVASPAAFAALGAQEAVVAILTLGVVLNAQILAMGDAAAMRRGEVARVLAAALPGAVAGALVLSAVPDSALQVTVGVAAIAAVVLQETASRRPRRSGEGPRPWPVGTAYPAGLVSGALTTTTTINGPPLVVWLRGRRAPVAQTRASLAATFIGLGAVGCIALALSGDLLDAFEPDAVALLVPAAVLGGLAGRRLIASMSERALERVTLGLVFAAGALAIATGLA